jgi:serine protease AprX
MQNREKIICPLCQDAVEKLVYRFHFDHEKTVIDKIKSAHPDWSATDGLCSRCLDYYQVEIVMAQRLLPSIGPYFPVKSVDDYVILPTGLRLDADARYTGKGITICFIDSGFSFHPDLTASSNRIKMAMDITTGKEIHDTDQQDPSCWHGTMTTVVCAGDGYLSKGLYKGIANRAELVLLKVQDQNGRITTENIVKALQWVLINHRKMCIRIVNLSVSDDLLSSYKDSQVDLLAEALIAEGVCVVAAVGNDDSGKIHPPANAPNVIAVGGVDDGNLLNSANDKAYHSTFGMTFDDFIKPELVAHAIWVAAPILRGTSEQEEAKAIFQLLTLPDESLKVGLKRVFPKTKLESAILESNDIGYIRGALKCRIQSAKYISPDYMHVDGTSFSAPVVTAVIAQLLEVNPQLNPAQVRQLLFSTARRIDGVAPERQGFGLVQPRKATLKVVQKDRVPEPECSPYVNRVKNCIEFIVHHEGAGQISLAGSFNQWAKDVLFMEPGRNGLWKIEIPMLPAGSYGYKYFVDESVWLEDVNNIYKEPDGFGGFNSLLWVENSLN